MNHIQKSYFQTTICRIFLGSIFSLTLGATVSFAGAKKDGLGDPETIKKANEQIAKFEAQYGKLSRINSSRVLVPELACSRQLVANGQQSQYPVDLYSVYDVMEAMDRERTEQSGKRPADPTTARLMRIYEEMGLNGGTRFVLSPPALEAFDVLRDEVPNFAEVIDDIQTMSGVYKLADEPMKMTPVLLLGDPGIGKTHFAKALSRIMGSGYKFISFSSLTAGWILSGANPLWSGAREGDVANTLLEGDYANPVVVLDEVDKAGGDHRYNTVGSLYSLLERDTASEFTDEFLQVKMDASHVLWIATANYAEQIPEPILKRMRVYVVPPPDEAATRKIALTIYRNFLNENPKLKLGIIDGNYGFPDDLGEEVYAALGQVPPREMRRAFELAVGLAIRDKRWHLTSKDIKIDRFKNQKGPLGFMQ